MKKLHWLAASVVATGGLAWVVTGCDGHSANFLGGWSNAELPASTNVVQTAGVPAALKTLAVKNNLGFVHITGQAGGTNLWTWHLMLRARTPEAVQKLAAMATCQATLTDGRLELVVTLPDSQEPHHFQSDLEITVPLAMATAVENQFGSTILADLTGAARVKSANGRVELHRLGGTVDAETTFDRLEANTTGPAHLRNQNGRIVVNDCNGALDAQTTFDLLQVKKVKGNANLHNQNGRIEAADIGGGLEAQTSFGSLVADQIGGPARLRNQNASIQASKMAGNTEAATSFGSLQVDEVQGAVALKNQNASVEASGVTGTVQATTSFGSLKVTGPGANFVCHNQNGSIWVKATALTVTNIEAHTSFGSLEVHVPAGLKPEVRAHTSFGTVKSDFPIRVESAGGKGSAELPPGTTRITLKDQNGPIKLVED